MSPTCCLGLAPQRDGAHDGGVQDAVGGVLGHAAQQAADALAGCRPQGGSAERTAEG